MQVLFKFPRRIGKTIYKASKLWQEVPDADACGQYWEWMVEAGDVEVKEQPVSEVSLVIPETVIDLCQPLKKTKRLKKAKNEDQSQH